MDVSGGDNNSIIDMKIYVSRGLLGAKLINFLGAPPMLTISRFRMLILIFLILIMYFIIKFNCVLRHQALVKPFYHK